MSIECCIYCGAEGESTRDHVPPRCLFSKPRPSNLVTVPCCSACNSEYAKQDEYFRIAITTGINPERFPKENADSLRAIAGLARPASLGFAKHLLQGYDRETASLTFEVRRIEIVLHRIVCGLFFHHRNVPLPKPVGFAFWLINDSLKPHQEGRERLERLNGKMTTIGPGVFRYALEPFDPPDPFGTVWLMRFYDHHSFFCVTALVDQ